ncbi:granzyme A-like [Cavia porcellus]|uniref:granzyme A-like n=1 Tax=Cavia porcellus TaxID=10141 RepID=UPI000661932E
MMSSYTFLASPLSTVIFLLPIPEDGCVRIIGGREVPPHSRPYMALLELDKEICAGALIAEKWVLTAAHCDWNKTAQVILGAHSITQKEPEKQIISIKKAFPHPYYDLGTHENDLKLLQLNKKAKINKYVNILQLPGNGNDVTPGTVCQVAGWGDTYNGSPESDILREVNVTVIDRKMCNNSKYYNFDSVIGLNKICAGSRHGGKDTCDGDSGSPLLCKGVFRGITSFRAPGKCGDPKKPGVYILLSKKYIHWINKTIKKKI